MKEYFLTAAKYLEFIVRDHNAKSSQNKNWKQTNRFCIDAILKNNQKQKQKYKNNQLQFQLKQIRYSIRFIWMQNTMLLLPAARHVQFYGKNFLIFASVLRWIQFPFISNGKTLLWSLSSHVTIVGNWRN